MEVYVQIDEYDTKTIEYYEIGSAAAACEEIAETYMQVEQFDGIIAVFDLNNLSKTIDNIIEILEIFNKVINSSDNIEDGHGSMQMPLLIIGNK